MSKIDQLFEELKKAKCELAKEMDQSGSMGTAGDSMMMSEEIKVEGSPAHEAAEKVKAKKIKEEAQEILDMHKAGSDKFETEVIKAHANGQWSLEKDNSVKPFGTSVYNQTANLGRKATRTGEEREGMGRNVAVRSYTTSGSKMSDTVAENNKKKYANAPVTHVTDPAKLKAIQDESNARMAAEAEKKKK